MYQALYRKYRPNNFNEVVGQKVIVQSLKNAIINDKLSHAYLFTGPRGTGKTTIAKIVGKTVNCLNNKNAISCDECINCIQYNSKKSSDIIEIDAASNNGVDEIRELKSKINLVPTIGKYKIYIIDEVHMLTTGAFNALLKTLEEPPSHVIFILATTDPHKIPLTILSRCQRFDFKKISEKDLFNRINYIAKTENINLDESSILEICRISDGGLRDSINFLDQAFAYSPSNIDLDAIHELNGTLSQLEIKNIIYDILTQNMKSLFQKIDYLDERGKNLNKIMEEIIYFLRNVLILKNIPEYYENNDNNKKIYIEISNMIDDQNLISMIYHFNNCLNQMKISNSSKLFFELSLIESMTKNQKNNSLLLSNQIQKEHDISNISEKDNKDKMMLKKLKSTKEIRINNTLSNFKKRILRENREIFKNFRSFVLKEEYNELVSLILEGEIKAASIENMIIVFEKEWMSQKFNINLIQIQKIFEMVYKKKYKLISTDSSDWEKIKNEFNNHIKKYIEIPENEPLEKILENEEDLVLNNIDLLFGNIVEYK